FEFLVGKIKKLYPTLLIIVLVLLVIIPLWQKMVDPEIVRSLLLKLTLFFNFIPGEALAVTGPFWFFSLIFQLYIIFPVLFYLMERYGQKILYWVSGVCLAITILFNDYFVAKDVSLLVLFVGQLPIFCMGIYFASRPVNRLPFALILTAIFIFAIGNVNRFIWHFSFLAFTLFMLSFLISIFPILKRSGKIYSFLLFSGSISLYLFAVHGVTRIPFEYLSEKYDNSFITTILSFIYLGGVYLLASFVRAFDQKVQKVI
ncbi:MAG: acyltransferase family protein, partial [Ginsengibacter sp.]